MDNIRFLIVDDSKISQRITAKGLADMGISEERLTYASTTEEAEEAWKKMPSHEVIVLLDIVLPGRGGGLRLLQDFKADDPDARIVILSSRTDREAILEARRLGASHYLLKPFKFEKFRDIVTRLMNPPEIR